MNVKYRCKTCGKVAGTPLCIDTFTREITTNSMDNSSAYTYEMFCHCKNPRVQVIVDGILVYEEKE